MWLASEHLLYNFLIIIDLCCGIDEYRLIVFYFLVMNRDPSLCIAHRSNIQSSSRINLDPLSYYRTIIGYCRKQEITSSTYYIITIQLLQRILMKKLAAVTQCFSTITQVERRNISFQLVRQQGITRII